MLKTMAIATALVFAAGTAVAQDAGQQTEQISQAPEGGGGGAFGLTTGQLLVIGGIVLVGVATGVVVSQSQSSSP